jgi:hypothetical protein
MIKRMYEILVLKFCVWKLQDKLKKLKAIIFLLSERQARTNERLFLWRSFLASLHVCYFGLHVSWCFLVVYEAT